MRPRHRMPVIFSLSMLDVLCCGLGAVILLMILYSWDARRQTTALATARSRVGEKAQRLEEAEAALAATNAELRKVLGQLEQKTTDLRQAETALIARGEEKAELSAKLDQSAKETAQLVARITKIEQEAAQTLARLIQAERAFMQARKEMLIHTEAQVTVQMDLAAAQIDLAQQQRATRALEKQRSDAQALAGRLPAMVQELETANKRAKDLDAQVGLLRRQVDAAGVQMSDAQKQNQAAQTEMTDLRKQLEGQRVTTGRLQQRLSQAETRFAGVDLSGRRAVFLVDTSGSMGSIDPATKDPKKWPEVSEQIVRLLRSLPQLEHYQVILFAEDTRYLLGQPDQWLNYDRETSAETLRAALKSVRPSGNTNLYLGFAAAFRFRAQGLDSIYLFSDGLPNLDPVLAPKEPIDDAAPQSLKLGERLRDAIRKTWNVAEPKVRIHAIGFFYERPTLGAFLWGLSRENGGGFVGMSKP